MKKPIFNTIFTILFIIHLQYELNAQHPDFSFQFGHESKSSDLFLSKRKKKLKLPGSM